MKTKARVAVLAVLAPIAAAAPALPEPKHLPRSIYVPVAFSLCEHLRNGVLYQDELAMAKMPARRIFQFTYYPDLGQLLPQDVQIRIEGTYQDGGEPFVARLAVTPAGVHTANRQMPLETPEAMKKQGRKIDVRLKEFKLNLACARFCRRSERPLSTEGD